MPIVPCTWQGAQEVRGLEVSNNAITSAKDPPCDRRSGDAQVAPFPSTVDPFTMSLMLLAGQNRLAVTARGRTIDTLRREALDLPAASGCARVAEAVVQAVLAVLPELIAHRR